MFLYVGIGVLVFLVALIAFIACRPSVFHVERTATVNAPPETVFAIINDLHQWALWSPWEHLDPNMKKTYSCPEAGVGASYAWNGNKNAGEGKLTISESKPGARVAMNLEFIRPFACQNQVDFLLTAVAGGTQVRWTMDGKNNFMAKAFGLMMNMDKLVGTDFETGLANLNKVAQSAPV
jgi:hypothetical protein